MVCWTYCVICSKPSMVSPSSSALLSVFGLPLKSCSKDGKVNFAEGSTFVVSRLTCSNEKVYLIDTLFTSTCRGSLFIYGDVSATFPHVASSTGVLQSRDWEAVSGTRQSREIQLSAQKHNTAWVHVPVRGRSTRSHLLAIQTSFSAVSPTTHNKDKRESHPSRSMDKHWNHRYRNQSWHCHWSEIR